MALNNLKYFSYNKHIPTLPGKELNKKILTENTENITLAPNVSRCFAQQNISTLSEQQLTKYFLHILLEKITLARCNSQ